jgi:AcrR family transcriptional regulator
MPKSKKTEEILKAAEKVYGSAGLDKVTVTDICEEADISRKTFYQRFKNLDELLESLLKHISETTINRMSANGDGENIWDQLWRMLDIYQIIGEAHPVVRAIYSARFDRWVSWKQITFADKLDQIIQHKLIGIIRNGTAAGVFREADAEALARTVTAIAGVNFFYYSNTSFFPETKAEEIRTGLKLMIERTLKPL